MRVILCPIAESGPIVLNMAIRNRAHVQSTRRLSFDSIDPTICSLHMERVDHNLAGIGKRETSTSMLLLNRTVPCCRRQPHWAKPHKTSAAISSALLYLSYNRGVDVGFARRSIACYGLCPRPCGSCQSPSGVRPDRYRGRAYQTSRVVMCCCCRVQDGQRAVQQPARGPSFPTASLRLGRTVVYGEARYTFNVATDAVRLP